MPIEDGNRQLWGKSWLLSRASFQEYCEVDGHNIVYVSAATAWEIAIKRAIGKLRIPESDYLEELRLHRFLPLSITTEFGRSS